MSYFPFLGTYSLTSHFYWSHTFTLFTLSLTKEHIDIYRGSAQPIFWIDWTQCILFSLSKMHKLLMGMKGCQYQVLLLIRAIKLTCLIRQKLHQQKYIYIYIFFCNISVLNMSTPYKKHQDLFNVYAWPGLFTMWFKCED